MKLTALTTALALAYSPMLADTHLRTLKDWGYENLGTSYGLLGTYPVIGEKGLYVIFGLRDINGDGHPDISMIFRRCVYPDGREEVFNIAWKVYDHKTKIKYVDLDGDGLYESIQTDGTGQVQDGIPLCEDGN